MRQRITYILPFIQIVIALVTLSRLPEPPPQYFCQPAAYNLIVCNPNGPVNLQLQ